MVPLSASSKRPMRSVRASVKAPFTCPKSSLSKVPSGSAPVLTATIGMEARGDRMCSVRATTSFPVPCSPVTITLASEGPMRAMVCNTGCMAGADAIKSGAPSARNRRASASRCWVRCNARCNSTWVRKMASRRSFSQGFWIKSRAPRRMASTASRTLPHAVITITGRLLSKETICDNRSRPSCPDVVSRV